MENLIISYAVKASLAMALLYALYVLCFRNDTLYKARRCYLLLALLFSVIYPFCQFELSTSADIAVYETILPQIAITNDLFITSQSSTKIELLDVALFIYGSGVVVLFLKLMLQLASIIKLRLRNRAESYQNYKLIYLDGNVTPFSFFCWIFISKEVRSQEDHDVMMMHEKVHADQYHSIDVILTELFCIAFWWNPIAWLLKKEIVINLEYLADQGTLDEGFETKKYQYLLLEVIKTSATIPIVNNFNVSQLKKRIIMMNKTNTSKIMSLKYLLAIPAIALMLLGNVQNSFSKPIENEIIETSIPEKDDDVFAMVEQMPEFPGGTDALMKFIGTNLKYPEKAIAENVEGRVVIRFVVSKIGEIRDVTVLRSLEAECDAEAVRVVEAMPTWTPGKQSGVAVDVYYTLPIMFKLTPKNNAATTPKMDESLFLVDGKVVESINDLDKNTIESVSVIKNLDRDDDVLLESRELAKKQGKTSIVIVTLKK